MLRFADPVLGVLVASAAAAYVAVWIQTLRRGRRDAVRFSDPELLAALVDTSPGWRRHVAPAATALALVGLAVAAANPQLPRPGEREVVQVVLAIDVSPSMLATDVAPTRLAAAQVAARRFVRAAPDGVEIGLLAFSGSTRPVLRPTANRLALLSAIERLDVPSGGTATGDALIAAAGMLSLAEQELADDPTGTIVLLSDGDTNVGRSPLDAAQELAELGVVVNAVGIGTPEATFRGEPMLFNEEELAEIAALTGGESFSSDNAEDLVVIFERLGSSIEDIFLPVSLSHLVATGSALLLALGAVVGLRRSPRVP